MEAMQAADLFVAGGSDADIRRIAARDTVALRNAILRPGLPPDRSIYPGDDAPDTLHLGAFLDDTLVAVATLCREAVPPEAVPEQSTTSWRLRGMAARPEFAAADSASNSCDAASPMPSSNEAHWCGAPHVSLPCPSIARLASGKSATPSRCPNTATRSTSACNFHCSDFLLLHVLIRPH